ncbi:MAG: MBL fold metallo-hydrolase [Cytophagales bacterium]|nr:MAG: MBL fold metallo-hydrolase [Cytophagales bacterium]
MTLQTIDTGFFKLDGGAMFGVVPKSLWNKLNPADERNLCTWAMRCLLLEAGNQLVLVDTGMGDKQDARFFGHYDLHRGDGPGDANLLDSIRKAGYSETDITDVFLTHLHFDHVGGAVRRTHGGNLVPTFPNARYWSHSEHWQWATNPNARERASFLSENILPIQASGQLSFMNETPIDVPGLETIYVDGHTEKMALPKLTINGKTLLFCADLIPSSHHLPLPWIMSYDVRPLLTMDEKTRILQQAAAENWVLVFQHDPLVEAATVEMTEKGVRLKDKGPLQAFM